MKELIRKHALQYPKSRPCDMVKLLYQGEFGGGHLSINIQYVLDRLKSEVMDLKQTEVCKIEKIGGGLVRFPLKGMQVSGLSVDTVAALFMETCAPRGSKEDFASKLNMLRDITLAGEMPFSAAELDAYLCEYRAQGMPAVSHSPEYREAYAPSYRLMPTEAETYLKLFSEIDKRLKTQPGVLIKIDGGSASGKSTLGALLQRVYQGQLFHMDDYFLPMARKTPERLAEPGGNVDYERFLDEVDGEPVPGKVRFRPYSCRLGALQAWEEVPEARVRIIEGAYSLHPALCKPDISVFLEIDPEKQKERISKRNGEEMLTRFIGEWIPMEKKYFEAFSVRESCDMCFRV